MINIVTALQCEAKPLIDRYRLRGRSSETGFRLYENDRMRLIVSGVGKMAAAAATAYLYAANGEGRNETWLNVGVAGHDTLALGTAVLAHKISDDASGLSWYPPQLLELPCTSHPMITVDEPHHAYHRDNTYEMEASGFYSTAIRFSSGELVQCLKVISDNRHQGADEITPALVERLIGGRLTEIDQCIEQLDQLARELRGLEADPLFLDECLARWRFSQYQRHQLRQLLQRRQVLLGNSPLWNETPEELRGAKAVLAYLTEQLDQAAVTL